MEIGGDPQSTLDTRSLLEYPSREVFSAYNSFTDSVQHFKVSRTEIVERGKVKLLSFLTGGAEREMAVDEIVVGVPLGPLDLVRAEGLYLVNSFQIIVVRFFRFRVERKSLFPVVGPAGEKDGSSSAGHLQPNRASNRDTAINHLKEIVGIHFSIWGQYVNMIRKFAVRILKDVPHAMLSVGQCFGRMHFHDPLNFLDLFHSLDGPKHPFFDVLEGIFFYKNDRVPGQVSKQTPYGLLDCS